MNISTDWITEPGQVKVFTLPSAGQRFILQPEDWLWLGRPDHVTPHGHLQDPWTLQSVQMTPSRSGPRSPQAAAPGDIH